MKVSELEGADHPESQTWIIVTAIVMAVLMFYAGWAFQAMHVFLQCYDKHSFSFDADWLKHPIAVECAVNR